MNLAKKSTILLAALSVFALTSCNKSQSLTYDKALAWIKENYTHEERDFTHTKVTWDYKNNKETGTTPASWTKCGSDKEPGNKKLNWFIQFALNGEFDIENPSESTGTEEVEGRSAMDKNLFTETLDEEEFKTVFEDEDATFSLSGKELTIVKTIDYSTKGNEIPVTGLPQEAAITIYYKQIETYHFDSKGFLKDMIVKLDAADCGIKYTYGGTVQEESPKLGKVDTSVKLEPFKKA